MTLDSWCCILYLSHRYVMLLSWVKWYWIPKQARNWSSHMSLIQKFTFSHPLLSLAASDVGSFPCIMSNTSFPTLSHLIKLMIWFSQELVQHDCAGKWNNRVPVFHRHLSFLASLWKIFSSILPPCVKMCIDGTQLSFTIYRISSWYMLKLQWCNMFGVILMSWLLFEFFGGILHELYPFHVSHV